MTEPREFSYVRPGGARQTFLGWRLGVWEDGAYDEAKKLHRKTEGRKETAVEGRRYEVIELGTGGFVFVTTVDEITIGESGSRVEPRQKAEALLELQDREELLSHFRRVADVRNGHDPVVNLMTDMGWEDIVEDWRRDL